MVSTWVKLSHRDWISSTPRKAAKMYQVANWCLRSSGSLGGFFAFGSAAVSRLSPKPRNCRKRQPGAGSLSLVGFSRMSLSCAGRSWVALLVVLAEGCALQRLTQHRTAEPKPARPAPYPYAMHV